VVLWGDGHQKRELVYVDDFVRTLIELVPLMENDLVNVGGGEDHTIREFASEISRIVGYDSSRIEYDASRYTGATSKLLSIRKLRGFFPEYSPRPLEEGLRSSIAWFYNSKAYL